GDATRRKIVVTARERASSDVLLGDPTVAGATLRIVAHGTTDSAQTYGLPAGPAWRRIGSPPSGYRYSAPNGPGAVRTLLVKRTAAGTFGMKIALLGRLGPIDVVPPDVGTEGGILITIPGGGAYCVDFGGPAGESFFTYVQHRMSGFGGTSDRQVMRDIIHYRTFLELKMPEFARPMVNLATAPKAIGEVRYVDRAPLEQECARYQRIVA